MKSNLSLHFGGLFLSFSLQVAAAYLTCSLVNLTLVRPRQRFRVLVGFLAGSVIYWMGLVAWQLRLASANPGFAGSTTGGDTSPALPSLFLPLALPPSWAPAILIAGEVLATAYAATVLVLLGVNAWRQLHLWILLRHGRAPADDIRQLFEEIRRELGVRRCELVVLPGLASPATVGWLRPRVMLPVVCDEMSANSRLADVLHHELAHVARRDYLWASLSDMICRILFFHPAIWRARKVARFQGELACDLAVVEAQPERRADYADSLAYFVRLRMMEEKAALGLDFASSASSLGTRIRFILADSPALPWWRRLPRRAAAVAMTSAFALAAPALTVSLGFFQPLKELPSTPVSALPAAKPVARGLLHSTTPTKLPAVTDLSKLRVSNSVSNSNPYELARSDSRGSGGSARDLDRPWREANPRMAGPSMAEVLGSAVAIAISRGDHDRDHDDKHVVHQQ